MVISLLGAASNVASQLSGGVIKSSGTNDRLAQNATNYGLAQQGNLSAVNALAARAGWGPNGAIDTGDAQAKVDAQNKITALVNAGTIKGDPWPPPPGFPRIVFSVVDKVTSADGKTAEGGKTGTSLQPATNAQPSYLMIGAVVLLGFIAFKSFRRG